MSYTKGMKQSIYRFILYPAREVYRFIFQPKTQGVKAIIYYKDQILLIKNTYGDQKWNVPGGGIKRNESLVDAIKREVYEEVGIKLYSVKKAGSFNNIDEYKHDTITVFMATVFNNIISIDNAEIKEAKWFKLSKIPTQNECAKTLLKVLKYIR